VANSDWERQPRGMDHGFSLNSAGLCESEHAPYGRYRLRLTRARSVARTDKIRATSAIR
jgi:hypothetical protein